MLSDGVQGATEDIQDYNDVLNQSVPAMKKSSKASKVFGDILNYIGTAALTTLALNAVFFVIGKISEAIDNHIHKLEHLVQAGESAKDKIKNIQSELDQKQTFADNSQEEFVELRSKVDPDTNRNLKLTNEEYDKYIEYSKQIAEMYPELVKSYDSQGNAILDLSGNAATATEELKKLLETEKEIASYRIGDDLTTSVSGTLARIT